MAAATVMARSGLGMRAPGCGPRRCSGATAFGTSTARPPLMLRMVRPALASFRPRAFARGCYPGFGGGWGASEADMKAMFAEMERLQAEWKKAAASGEGFGGSVTFGPGGLGYVYGRCKPHARSQQGAEQSGSGADGKRRLALDVAATEEFYLLFADVPGLEKADLSIKLSKERIITIAGQRKSPLPESPEAFLQSERAAGAFERAWPLPEDADEAGAISARVTDGVLTVTVPKKAKAPEPEPAPEDQGQDIAID